MDSRITNSRRRFVEMLSQSSKITFSELRSALVGKNGMNLATLYRIVDAFREKGLIHEMTLAGERVIFPCQCDDPKANDAIIISFCNNCGSITDSHTRSLSHIISSETIIQTKNCSRCFK